MENKIAVQINGLTKKFGDFVAVENPIDDGESKQVSQIQG